MRHSEPPVVANHNTNIESSDQISDSQSINENDFIQEELSGISDNNVEEKEDVCENPQQVDQEQRLRDIQEAL